MLKETETEETRRFCHLFLIGNISIGEGQAPAPPPRFAYGALAMIARSWLFCYDMLGNCITKTCLFFDTKYNYLFHTELECGSESWKRKRWKRLNFCGSGSTLMKETGSRSD